MSAMPPRPPIAHRWRFFRAGGVDQPRIDGADDLRALPTLDAKLWAALACPVKGLDMAPQTLALLDHDGDGRLRRPEVVAAVQWVCERLHDPGLLWQPGDALPLDALATDGEGQALRTAAGALLQRLGRPPTVLAPADVAEPVRLFPPDQPNGDGVVSAALAQAIDPDTVPWLERVGAAVGWMPDRSGQQGIDADALLRCAEAVRAVRAWRAAQPEGVAAVLDAALAALQAVAAKVDDHFVRCQLAAFDARAAIALDVPLEPIQALAATTLAAGQAELVALPLAHVDAEAVLPLTRGLNPAWQAAMARLYADAVLPLLGARDHLSWADWQALRARLADWEAWRAQRPDTPVADWDEALLQAWEAQRVGERLGALIEHDRSAATLAQRLDDLVKLLALRRDLVRLLRNFVNFSDFYGAADGLFQCGRLYIDRRECLLCLPVADAAAHAQLAGYSGLYLVYCHCERADQAPQTIVAALTAGDAPDFMVPGRNGVFIDRQGRDWHARVVKVVENPISLRQAFWAPYKRVARLVGEQVRKWAAAREQQVQTGAAQQVEGQAEAAAGAARKEGSATFDIARFAGIFAAIGLALGALGSALVAVVTGFVQLAWWQMPLVVVGVMLLISGPSVLLAWFKLRARNIGPLLDANGWAVNTRARIGPVFGRRLTALAALPEGAERSAADPDASRGLPWGWIIAVAVLALAALGWRLGGWASLAGS
ncbi:hypothetical protein ACPP3B_02895 [Tepidimonas sp. HKU77]|uniref:hypothetical protein n=1 Tax=Tepidimonas sp. HKU77 TaxID=3414503 RepID=UPI003C7A59B4